MKSETHSLTLDQQPEQELSKLVYANWHKTASK